MSDPTPMQKWRAGLDNFQRSVRYSRARLLKTERWHTDFVTKMVAHLPDEGTLKADISAALERIREAKPISEGDLKALRRAGDVAGPAMRRDWHWKLLVGLNSTIVWLNHMMGHFKPPKAALGQEAAAEPPNPVSAKRRAPSKPPTSDPKRRRTAPNIAPTSATKAPTA